jgi:UBX domain
MCTVSEYAWHTAACKAKCARSAALQVAEDDDADLAAAIAASLSQHASQAEQMPQSAQETQSQGMAAQSMGGDHVEHDTQPGRDADSLPPSASSYNCELCVRLPDGKRVVQRFDRGRPLKHVVDWLAIACARCARACL